METLGLNPNLKDGNIGNKGIGGNIYGSQNFTDEQLNYYTDIINAADNAVINNYGIIDTSQPDTIISGTETQAGREEYIQQQEDLQDQQQQDVQNSGT